MKKLVALVLALLTLAMPCLSMAVEYPVNADETVVIWKVLDGSIAEGGYTTSMDTPGFKAWVEAAGINVTLQEYADNNALLLAIAGAAVLLGVWSGRRWGRRRKRVLDAEARRFHASRDG